MSNITEPSPDDKHLVAKVLGGDTRAFGTIVKNTEKLVAQIVYKMIPVEEDRKHQAQDTFLMAYKRLTSFQRWGLLLECAPSFEPTTQDSIDADDSSQGKRAF